MIIEDVTYQTKNVGKLGPILPSFQHAPCNPASLETSTRNVDISVDWATVNNKPDIGKYVFKYILYQIVPHQPIDYT